ncbi:class I SAM-dependent methyltransferase [Pseudomonas aeruginosa]|uniref:class I SAM-dependent methyltransferase n=1 Tax=Pseudomonas aeruginosa group TaxID=136841 RepID=UPI00071C053A|nr:class I SAM-dependent methyltransferase [Pseudomonas aeruginosa]KSR44870.1 SAM-dependent methyltransferase [Pseudomonas aeruginosa]MCR3764449.1 class I SAM-dependent methyltransferase [Pseudomonas aeruginosa]RPU99228.1 class I SAM-dependent methyltransferase [Pseudomonas aeruginosa]HBN8606472.1 class I SAM-dependent methyltransferase [Pseudomonas aeruginosa]HBP5568164.1 class I SAM-dependent methyltransferase [Pseudomonas aeruginosa]
MSQNIYDCDDFFAGYSQLPRSREGLAGAPEWPALRAMLPELTGKRVVDLGCGFGWFCRWAREQGASEVLGIDVSQNMLGKARAMTDDPAIHYLRQDLETLELPVAAFDFAYSSLALHYIEDLRRLLGTLHAALRPGGGLVFSIEHPIYMAPSQPGWRQDGEGRRTWPLDGYSIEGPRSTDWLARGVIKHHRTLGTLLNLLLELGFRLTRVEEWSPSDAQLAARPELAEERERPMLLLVSALR